MMDALIPPVSADLDRLWELIRRQAPELQPTVRYLIGTMQRLSGISLENLLAIPGPDPLTLDVYHQVVEPGTSAEDLMDLIRWRLTFADFPAHEKRLHEIVSILEQLLDHEARAKIERLIGPLET